jgi:hypothetical protein
MSISSDIKDMLTRKTIGINKEFTYIIPMPDKINFYDTKFTNVEAPTDEIEKDEKPYFICKYFNPDRFTVDGDRETIEDPDSDRLKNWTEVGKVIRNNQNYSCSGKINKDFFNSDKLFYDTDIIILLYVFTGRQNALLNGFVMCDDLNILPDGVDQSEAENSLYIDAICSNPRKPRRMGKPLPQVSFGRKLLDHVKEFAREKEYHGLSLSSLMYIINYYRKYGFRHLQKLTGDVQYEDEKIKMLADNNLKYKFNDDTEMEDFMWVEIVERMLKEKDLEIKQRELKKYWTKRGLFYEDSSEEEKDEVVKEIINFYNDNYEGTQIGEFILELEKQGFSTERVHLDGNRKVKRQSKRQMMKTMLPESNKQASWNEGFKMSYSFANENMPSQEDEIELDIDLTELDRIDKEVEDLGNNNIQNGGDKK